MRFPQAGMLDRNQTALCLLQEIRVIDLSHLSPALEDLEPCKHVYLTNLDRSRIPGPDQSPNGTTVWSVAAVCQKCRYHLDLVIDFDGCTKPCPSEGHPYHHFLYLPTTSPAGPSGAHCFVCSSTTCQAKVMAIFEKPVLHDEDIMYLSDPVILAARFKAARLKNPDLRDKSPADILSLFQGCINDALRNENRDIPAENKMFKAWLGDGMKGLFNRLGFTKVEAVNDTKARWKLPQPPKHAFKPSWDPLRRQLEDVRDELTLLILQKPDTEKQLLKGLPQALTLSQQDFERVLGIHAVDARSLNLANAFPGEHAEEVAYRRLGVVPHLSDPLIIWAYGQQIDADPGQRQYYLKCLKEIATGRQSESLQTEAAIAESLEPDSAMNDGFGKGNDSPIISSYPEALSFLEAHADTADEFVWTLMTAKCADNASSESTAREAVRIIADYRTSEVLRNQLAGSDPPKSHMDLKKAHTTLGVSEDIEPEHLIAQFETNIKESPSREAEFRDALGIIAESRDNSQLNKFVRSLQYPSGTETAIGEPRPIKNIGNTCYLNSLLQYLYTIKPLRDLVSRLDTYKENAESSSLPSKRVGDLAVNVAQVRRSLKFAQELDKLFESLETATTPFVTPSIDLAHLTLVNVVDEVVRRRQSTIGGQRPADFSTTTATLETLVDAPENGDSDQPVDIPEDLKVQNGETSSILTADPMQIDSEENRDVDMVISSEDIPKSNGVPPSANIIEEIPGNTNSPPVPPRPKPDDQVRNVDATREVENWAIQQDVGEVMKNVLNQLRWAIKAEGSEKDGEQIDLVSRLFGGKEQCTVMNKKTGEDKEEIQPFFEIPLYLREACDIYTALDGTLDLSAVEGEDNKFTYRTITEIPPVLQMVVSRVGYNKVTATSFKVEDPLHLEERIYMDRYMADDKILAKRRQAWTWKSELEQLRVKKSALTVPGVDMNVAGALRNTNGYLKGLASAAEELELDPALIDEPLLLGIERLAGTAEDQISQLDTQLVKLEQDLATVFGADKHYPYRLHAVFIHRGDSRARGGHWFIYIFDTEAKIWRCYNDETISTVVNAKSIFTPAKDWVEGTSSFIVYVREDRIEEIIDTVLRNPEPQFLHSPSRSPPHGSEPKSDSGATNWANGIIPTGGGWDVDPSGDSSITW